MSRVSKIVVLCFTILPHFDKEQQNIGCMSHFFRMLVGLCLPIWIGATTSDSLGTGEYQRGLTILINFASVWLYIHEFYKVNTYGDKFSNPLECLCHSKKKPEDDDDNQNRSRLHSNGARREERGLTLSPLPSEGP
eukprot:UN15739